MRNFRTTGFTIVELLIVIVVIGILASITIVAYNGVSQRAAYAKMESDFGSIQKAIELYKAQNGTYPDSSLCESTGGAPNYEYGWCGWEQGQGNSFIPGVAPDFIAEIPTLSADHPQKDTYLYKSSVGTDGLNVGTEYYQLIRYKAGGLTKVEIENAPLNGPDYIVEGKPVAWGVKSDSSIPWW